LSTAQYLALFLFGFLSLFFFFSAYIYKKMGCCASIEQDVNDKIRNDEIDQQLQMEKLNEKDEIKLLLLGKKETVYKCPLHAQWYLCVIFFCYFHF
jgi:hypothetical protein